MKKKIVKEKVNPLVEKVRELDFTISRLKDRIDTRNNEIEKLGIQNNQLQNILSNSRDLNRELREQNTWLRKIIALNILDNNNAKLMFSEPILNIESTSKISSEDFKLPF